MPEDPEIRVLRAPDGRPIASTDPALLLPGECVVGEGEQNAGTVFLRLELLREGGRTLLWLCTAQTQLDDPGIETRLNLERKAEIVAAHARWQRQSEERASG